MQVVQADGKEEVKQPSKSPSRSPRKKAQMALMRKRGGKDIPSEKNKKQEVTTTQDHQVLARSAYKYEHLIYSTLRILDGLKGGP